METSTNVIASSMREEARNFIPKIASANDVFKLFHLLKYPTDRLFDSTYTREVDKFEFKKEDRDTIKAIYTVFSYDKDLPVFLMEATTAKVLADRHLRSLQGYYEREGSREVPS